jgi:hypothetical protein
LETYILSVTAKAEQIPFHTPLSGLVTGSYLTPITSGAFSSARLIDSFLDVLDHQTAKILLISPAACRVLPRVRSRFKSVSERVAAGV